MNTRRSYSWLIVLATGLLCMESHAQYMRLVPEGNSAFSVLKIAPQARVADDEFISEAALLKSLYYELKHLSRYTRAGDPVTIIRLPHAELEAMVCKRPCNILGYYLNGQIFLDDRLRPERDLYDRSVLLHELMHYLQDVNLAYGADITCERWYQREVEAYATQQQFLSASGSPVHLHFAGIQSMCRENGARQATLEKQ
jgi:hypothetical protein